MDKEQKGNSRAASGTADDQDHLKWLLDRTSNYIRDVDTKNGVILAALAVMAAVLFSNEWFCTLMQKSIMSQCWVSWILIGLIGVLFVVVVVFLFLSLVPRLDTGEKNKSLVFFNDISSFDNKDALLKAYYDSEYSVTDDLLSQIYINSKIAAKKMKWHSWAIKVFAMFVLVVLVFCLVEVLFL